MRCNIFLGSSQKWPYRTNTILCQHYTSLAFNIASLGNFVSIAKLKSIIVKQGFSFKKPSLVINEERTVISVLNCRGMIWSTTEKIFNKVYLCSVTNN